MEPFSTLIHFRCRATEHQQPRLIYDPDHPGSPITFHDGQWAYCLDGAADGHVWESIAPAPLTALRRNTSEHDHASESGGRLRR
jgi:hypothetical protein